MKTPVKITVTVALVLIIVTGVTHIILTRQLTRILNAAVIPELEQSLGAPVTIKESRLSLWHRTLDLSGINVTDTTAGAPAIALSGATATFRLRPLLSGELDLTDLHLRGLEIVVRRDGSGKTYVVPPSTHPTATAETGAVATAAVPPPQPVTAPVTAPVAAPVTAPASTPAVPARAAKTRKPLAVTTRTLTSDIRLTYEDAQISDPPLRLVFVFRISGKDLTTSGTADDRWGTLNIAGHLADDPEAFVMQLSGQVAPLSDPELASFDMEGRVTAIDPARFGALTQDVDFQADNMDVDLKMQCRNGSFVTAGSEVTVTLDKPRLTGDLAEKARGIELPASLIIQAPLTGTLAEPQVDIQAAILKTVLQNLGGQLGDMLRNATIDGKPLDENLGEAAKVLGNFLQGL